MVPSMLQDASLINHLSQNPKSGVEDEVENEPCGEICCLRGVGALFYNHPL